MVRAILPASWGQAGIIASTPVNGQNFSTTINYTLPANYNENKIKLVAFVSEYTLNHQADEVFNAAEINLPLQTAVNENVFTNNISVYPNPTNQNTTLKFDNAMKGNCTLTVYNSYGQQVKQFVIRNSDSFVIRRDNLPGGLYFLRLTTSSPFSSPNGGGQEGAGWGEVIATGKLVITD